jgi:hypothetical protein
MPGHSESKGQLDAQTKINQNYHSKPFCYTTTTATTGAANFNNYLNHTSNVQNPQTGTTSFSGLRKVSKMNR